MVHLKVYQSNFSPFLSDKDFKWSAADNISLIIKKL
jgi:hypothetical protein